ncbi:MAG: OmpA family protein [Pseudomonadota bacterium]
MRRFLNRGRVFFIFAAAAAATPFAAAATDCAALAAEAEAARGDAATLASLHEAALRDCDLAVSAGVARSLGFALFNAAREAPEAERLDLLERAAGFAKDWRVLAALGAEQLRRGDRTGAAGNLQAALVVLQEDPPTPPPPREAVERLLAMANNARAAAPKYVKAQTTRSGAPGGIAADRVAGVEIEAVPFPIEFLFNEATPTEDGVFAIGDLAELMAAAAPQLSGKTIVLAGHTDPVGGDAYNLALSEERAAAVRAALLSVDALSGLDIRAVGCGEASPPRIESPEFYTEEEIHQIMRRVELVRSGSPCK